MGRAMRATKSGTGPNSEQNSPAYLKKPISPRSIAAARISHSFPSFFEGACAMRRAQNQSARAIPIRSSTYFGSPQA